ncbi:MAG: hypothetical protein ACP5FL_09340, partial [Thermoplasmatota archaeon]
KTAMNEYDPNLGNDRDNVTIYAPTADIELTKSVDTDYPNAGESIVFSLSITNQGPDTATGVIVSDLLPPGVSYLSHIACFCTSYNPSNGNWVIGTLQSNEIRFLNITVTVTKPGTTINIVELTASDQFDPDSAPNNNELGEDDQDAASFYAPFADLEVTKSVDNMDPSPGETIVFTITVNNTGPDNATNVEVTDSLSLGFIHISNTTTQGFYNNATGIWDIGTLTHFSSATLTITAELHRTNITNSAELTLLDQFDPDSTPGNHVPEEDDQDEITLGQTPRIYVPKIAVAVSGLPLEPGDIICYIAWVNNTGGVSSNDNLGNEFEDVVPDYTTYVSGTVEINGIPDDDDISDGIGYDAANDMIIWNGVIPAQGSVRIRFCVRIDSDVPSGTLISNQGTVYYDSDGDGINDAEELTDDPETTPLSDPTNVNVDYVPPWSWMTVTLDPDGYFISASIFHIYAADDVGPWKIFYRIDNGMLHEGNWNQEMHFQINALHGYQPGLHTVEYWAVDAAGNVELPHHVETYVLDTSGPDVSLSFEGIAELAPGQVWQITPVTELLLEAVDNAVSVDRVMYRVDQGDWHR